VKDHPGAARLTLELWRVTVTVEAHPGAIEAHSESTVAHPWAVECQS
jgi:hypothetical protein